MRCFFFFPAYWVGKKIFKLMKIPSVDEDVGKLEFIAERTID